MESEKRPLTVPRPVDDEATSPTRIEALDLELNEVDVWEHGVTSDVFLYVDGERIAPDYFPGVLSIEVTQSLCYLYQSVTALRRDEEPFPWMFPCGSCGEPGCTQISWRVSRADDEVEILMRGYREPLGDGRYRLPYAAYVGCIVRFFDDFVARMGARNVASFDGLRLPTDDLRTLDDFEALRDDLVWGLASR